MYWDKIEKIAERNFSLLLILQCNFIYALLFKVYLIMSELFIQEELPCLICLLICLRSILDCYSTANRIRNIWEFLILAKKFRVKLGFFMIALAISIEFMRFLCNVVT